MKLIRFTLRAPLQSWGERGRWDRRDTGAMPTKSAVIGLLGCCLGYPRGDARLADLSRRVHLAVRADRPGTVMTDFHTVQARSGALSNAAGKPRSGSGTLLTPRQYLQDACFTAFLWGDEATLAQCAAALRHPHWPPCLGRRSCVPSVPVLPEWMEAASVDEAVRAGLPAGWAGSVQIEMLPGEAARSGENVVERRDEPVRADYNEYLVRRVRVPHEWKGGEAE